MVAPPYINNISTLMSELQQAREPQRLFKYAIDRHIKLDQKEKIHFYRANRWRYNTFNRFNFLKVLKLKGPITFGIFAGIVVDYTYGFYSNPAAH